MSRVSVAATLGMTALLGATLGFVGGRGAVGLPFAGAGRTAAPASFADIVERLNSAVVHVDVVDLDPTNVHEGIEAAPEIAEPQRGEGSGFVVDSKGYILTNHHLVSRPARVRVRFADRRELPARVVGSDEGTDVALLKVEAVDLPTVPLGDSDRLRVGEWVCAIGNPLSFDHSVTVGVVSSKGRKIFNASLDAYIQTDAAINPGNSGGPLLNTAGEAVGISSAVSSEGQGIGFAVPINVARTVMDQLRSRGRVSRGFLGVQLHDLEPDLAPLLGLKETKGVVVLDVVPGSPGEAAGLQRYDVIVSVSRAPVGDGDELVRRISGRAPGADVMLGVLREGRPLELSAKLGERQEPQASPTPKVSPAAGTEGDALGLAVADPTPAERTLIRSPSQRRGVMVRDVLGLDPGTDLIAVGDVVVEVNRKATPNVKSYREALSGLPSGSVAWLYVYRPKPEGTFLTKVIAEGKR